VYRRGEQIETERDLALAFGVRAGLIVLRGKFADRIHGSRGFRSLYRSEAA